MASADVSLGLTLSLLRIMVEEHAGHHRKVTTLEPEDSAAEQTPENNNRVTATDVAGYSDVDKSERRDRVVSRQTRCRIC